MSSDTTRRQSCLEQGKQVYQSCKDKGGLDRRMVTSQCNAFRSDSRADEDGVGEGTEAG